MALDHKPHGPSPASPSSVWCVPAVLASRAALSIPFFNKDAKSGLFTFTPELVVTGYRSGADSASLYILSKGATAHGDN